MKVPSYGANIQPKAPKDRILMIRTRLRGGFTLVEAMVVIAIITILASLLLARISQGQSQARRVQCMNNLRQLILTWSLYRSDNDDKLVANGSGNVDPYTIKDKLWVWGGDHHFLDGFTNRDYLLKPEQSLFSAYIKSPHIYKCPEDRSLALGTPLIVPKVRSYALNGYLGSVDPNIVGPNHVNFIKGSDFTTVSPSLIFAFQDLNPPALCRPAVINLFHRDSFFHLPASHHNGSGVLTFADGHAEAHKWQDKRTVRIFSKEEIQNIHDMELGDLHDSSGPNNPDLKWMQDRASVLK